jgi:hypothetical protein
VTVDAPRDPLPRPVPPLEQLGPLPNFLPAPDVLAWLKATFLDPDSQLFNQDHEHLGSADLGILWTNVANAKQMRSVVGQAEMPVSRGGRWAKARADIQLEAWFGMVPDFVITLDATYCAQAPDDQWCALVEHELYHCGQDRDEFGLPKFTKLGKPVFAMRGHDIEEFVGVARRYGMEATGLASLHEALSSPRAVQATQVSWACGTCGRA